MFEIPGLWLLFDLRVHQMSAVCSDTEVLSGRTDNGLWNLSEVSVFWLVLARSCWWPSEGHRRFQLHNNSKKEGPGCAMAQWLNTDGPVKTLGPNPITAQKDKWKNRPRAWRLASMCPHTLPPGRASFKRQLNQWASKHDLTKPNIWIFRKWTLNFYSTWSQKPGWLQVMTPEQRTWFLHMEGYSQHRLPGLLLKCLAIYIENP